jgi:Heat shock protein 9/12
MSDLGRKDFSTKAKEEVTPDSSKSTLDRTKESVTDTTDRVMGEVQPDSHKSTTQSTFDKGKRETDGTFLDKAKVSRSYPRVTNFQDTLGLNKH